MTSTQKLSFMRSSCTLAFAALMCVSCFVSVPLSLGVPIGVQNMLAVAAGAVLGGIHGAGAVGVFLLAGALGLPVFSGCRGGLSVVSGPTGGYLWGYFLGSLVSGLLLGIPSDKKKRIRPFDVFKVSAVIVMSYAVVFVPGVLWYWHSVSGNESVRKSFADILEASFFPFVAGDLLKAAFTVPFVLILRPVAGSLLYPEKLYEKEVDELVDRLKAKMDGNK